MRTETRINTFESRCVGRSSMNIKDDIKYYVEQHMDAFVSDFNDIFDETKMEIGIHDGDLYFYFGERHEKDTPKIKLEPLFEPHCFLMSDEISEVSGGDAVGYVEDLRQSINALDKITNKLIAKEDEYLQVINSDKGQEDIAESIEYFREADHVVWKDRHIASCKKYLKDMTGK